MATCEQNKRKFLHWVELADGGRRYWLDVSGHQGWRARYVKIVNSEEKTVAFYQEIYNEHAELVEIHEKFPVDRGHRKV
jgi:hypothetical protein